MKKFLLLMLCVFVTALANAQTPIIQFADCGIQVPTQKKNKNALYGVWTSSEFNICLLKVNKPDLCGAVVLSDEQCSKMIDFFRKLDKLEKKMPQKDKNAKNRTVVNIYTSFPEVDNVEKEPTIFVRYFYTENFEKEQLKNGTNEAKEFIATVKEMTDFFDQLVIDYQATHPNPSLVYFYETTSPSGLEGVLVINDKMIDRKTALVYADRSTGAEVNYKLFEQKFKKQVSNPAEFQKQLSEVLVFKEYEKPEQEMIVLDAPFYEFELLMSDGTRITSNDERECVNNPERSPKIRMDVDNMHKASQQISDYVDFYNKRKEMMNELLQNNAAVVR